MAHHSLADLLDFAIDAAWRAGRITLAYFQTDIQAERKLDNTPVTVADRRSEECVRDLIRTRFPDHAILGEEFGEHGAGARYRWIIDPIDGTKSFLSGVPLYSVLIGLERDGETVLGVANFPALNEMAYAARGIGCFWNGRRARVSEINRLEDARVMTSEINLFAQTGRQDVWNALIERTYIQRTWGDAYGYVLVATGRAEVMLDPATSVWDCAALKPILEEAGGTFTDWQGVPTIHGRDSMATNQHLFQPIMTILQNPLRPLR